MIKLMDLIELTVNNPNGFKWEYLITLLQNYYHVDNGFFNDMGMHNINDIRREYHGAYVIRELVALNLHKEIEDKYIKTGKVIMDGNDYTEDYLRTKKMYERE